MSDGNLKAPSQIFKWFEKMKDNYEKNILTVMQRFESNNNVQQNRLDKSHQSHLSMLQQNHANQIAQYASQVEQQKQEIAYFKQQITQQQNTITQLNSRYDTIIAKYITSQQPSQNFKDIFDDNCFINEENSTFEQAPLSSSMVNKPASNSIKSNELKTNNSDNNEIEAMYQQALEMRNCNNSLQAFKTFKRAAILGHSLAMGAIGRAYFLGEGVEKNSAVGLAWLINAAERDLPQAIKRVEYFKASDVDLYQQALDLAKGIANEL